MTYIKYKLSIQNQIPKMSMVDHFAIINIRIGRYLIKMDHDQIKHFEKEFENHLKICHKDLMIAIATDGIITGENDVRLKKIIIDFITTFANEQ